jgi:trafficking protein particle complex subunit 6
VEFFQSNYSFQVDKLQTNHRGVFVLSDYKFKWLDRYASDDIISKQAASRLLHFPCGILRGALANLGLSSIVAAEFNTLPSCTFTIRIKSP